VVTRYAFDGATLATATVPLKLAPRETATLPLPADVRIAGDPWSEVLRAESDFGRGHWHFAEDVDASLVAATYDLGLVSIDGGYRLAVTPRTFVRDLALLADRIAPDAVVDDMLVTLLPGETAVFEVRTAATLSAEAFADPLVLRSANQLATA
jgi:beta-mannosidase